MIDESVPPTGSPAESRRAARRAVEIVCDVMTSGGEEPVSSWCTDLSPYGLWLETDVRPAVGDRVVVSFKPTARHDEMTLFARVQRVCEDGGIGVGLELETTATERDALRRALKGIPPRFPRPRHVEALAAL
jgi:hypothetical protein